MALASTNVLVVKYATSNGCQQHLLERDYPKGGPSAFCLPERLSKIASGSDPDSSKPIAFWVSKCMRLFMGSLKVKSLVPVALLLSHCASPAGF